MTVGRIEDVGSVVHPIAAADRSATGRPRRLRVRDQRPARTHRLAPQSRPVARRQRRRHRRLRLRRRQEARTPRRHRSAFLSSVILSLIRLHPQYPH